MNINHRLIKKNSAMYEKQRKNKVFAEQYEKASAEAKSKKSGKYAILRRGSDSGYESDLEVFQR